MAIFPSPLCQILHFVLKSGDGRKRRNGGISDDAELKITGLGLQFVRYSSQRLRATGCRTLSQPRGTCQLSTRLPPRFLFAQKLHATKIGSRFVTLPFVDRTSTRRRAAMANHSGHAPLQSFQDKLLSCCTWSR